MTIISEHTLQPSRIEDIDASILDYVDNKLNLHTITNKGFVKVPVIWVSAERAYQIKHNRDLRDSAGVFKLPVISIERTSIVKDRKDKGAIWAHIPRNSDEKGGGLVISKRIQQDKTANFANADALRTKNQLNFRVKKNNKIVYQTISIPQPIYVNCMYNIVMRTEYQEQMNDLLSPFIVEPGAVTYFVVSRNGHQYECFIESDFSLDNNVSNLQEEERLYKTTVKIKVIGYIIGSDKNQEKPKIIVRENAVEFKFPREKVMMGDIPTHISGAFYR